MGARFNGLRITSGKLIGLTARLSDRRNESVWDTTGEVRVMVYD